MARRKATTPSGVAAAPPAPCAAPAKPAPSWAPPVSAAPAARPSACAPPVSTGSPAGKKAPCAVTHDMIAKRAYEIWVAQGRPQGMAQAHWRQAEQELLGKK